MDHDEQNASKQSQEKVLHWINESTLENSRYASDKLGIMALLISGLKGSLQQLASREIQKYDR